MVLCCVLLNLFLCLCFVSRSGDVILVQRASATTPAKKMARVMFDYEATQEDELSIKVDDTVEVIIDEKDPAEPGW